MTALLIAIVAALPPTIAAISALIVSIRNANKLAEIHITLNGRLSELLIKSSEASRLQGRTEAAATAAVLGKIIDPVAVIAPVTASTGKPPDHHHTPAP